MKHVVLVALLVGGSALAADAPDQSFEVAVDNAAATELTGSTACLTCRTVLVHNAGPNAIYCAPQSDVTANDGFPIAAGDSATFPAVRIWCIAATAAQSGTSGNNTRVWPSAS